MDQRFLNQPGVSVSAHSRPPETDPYRQVVSAIQACAGSTIAVPVLSHLLGVKSTTLNARFRRERIEVSMVARTSYIPCQLALNLAERHKHALIGWPTLREASQTTSVKAATIKARCEKGQLEGHVDLTKRLRINPAALLTLQIRASAPEPRAEERVVSPAAKYKTPQPTRNHAERRPTLPPSAPAPISAPLRYVQVSTPVPEVRFVTARDYGIQERPPERPKVNSGSPQNRRQPQRPLGYDPDRPPSVSECVVGKLIVYERCEGRILKVIDDPFSPQIRVHFPTHEQPEMREVLLAVGKRNLRY